MDNLGDILTFSPDFMHFSESSVSSPDVISSGNLPASRKFDLVMKMQLPIKLRCWTDLSVVLSVQYFWIQFESSPDIIPPPKTVSGSDLILSAPSSSHRGWNRQSASVNINISPFDFSAPKFLTPPTFTSGLRNT